MILPIVAYGDTVLRKVGQSISAEYEGLNELIANMWESMYKAQGIGLAAPQVGISKRFFVMHIDDENEDPYFFINPVIIKKSNNLKNQNDLFDFVAIDNKRNRICLSNRKDNFRAIKINGKWKRSITLMKPSKTSTFWRKS